MKHFSALLLVVFVAALAQAQTPATDMKSLVGRHAIVQRMPFYQPGTYQTIPNTYAGQTVTIIEVKPSAMFASIPKLTAGQMASLPPQSRENIENVRNASILVVQFADGTKADTGAMPVMPSNLPSYLEIVEDPVASGPAVVASVAAIATNPSSSPVQAQPSPKQICSIQPTKVKYSLGMSVLAGIVNGGLNTAAPPVAEVQWRNQSAQTMIAVRFAVQFFDVVDSPTYLQEVTLEQKLKPTKTNSGLAAADTNGGLAPAWFNKRNTHLTAWIERVKFADGSIWNDDGSHSCAVETIK
jgi:hypothetical protein